MDWEKSCRPYDCCDYKVVPLTDVADIRRLGDNTMLETPNGDVRDVYFDIPNLEDTYCKTVTTYELRSTGGDDSVYDGHVANDEANGEITVTVDSVSFNYES